MKMEKTVGQDDTQEIFQDCDTFVINGENKSEESSIKPNLQHNKSAIENSQQEGFQDIANYHQTKINNNHHHVVHVGIVIVLLTIYLGMTSVQKCLVSCVENSSINDQKQLNKKEIFNYIQNTKILERFLEHKDICKDLQIFTKNIEENQEEKERKKADEKVYEIDSEATNKDYVFKDTELSGSGSIQEGSSVMYEYSSGSSGSGDSGKTSRNKNRKSKYSIKNANSKNGFNKYNKSAKTKNQKKDINLNKKNSTAEPIIYLFALVFIYLLLKAASDINQHYKSQNKNDKRLRRCSLQSYAQTHRPDRRASKELALKQKQQHHLQQRLKSLSRSLSQDQQNYHYSHHQKQHLIDGSPQTSSEQNQQAIAFTPTRPNVSHSSNWQLLRQHTTTQSLDNSDILNSSRGNTEITTSMMTRRCSVPVALNYQRQKCSTQSPLSIVNDNVNLNVSLSRRPSVILSPLPLAIDTNDSFAPEIKRRVRMINRH